MKNSAWIAVQIFMIIKGVHEKHSFFVPEWQDCRLLTLHLCQCFGNIESPGKNGLWDKIHLRLQSMNDSNHHYKILISFNIPFIFRC
jgi:hypothetical protein